MKRLCIMLVCGICAVTFFNKPAMAVKPFMVEFQGKYKDNAEFAAAVKKAGCKFCHPGKSKKIRTAYGKELSKLLDKKKDAKNPEAIQAAMDKVAAMKTGDTTYGDLIKKGDLDALAKE